MLYVCLKLIASLFAEASVLATSTPYFPTLHLEQDDSPVPSVNCPRRQLVHVLAPVLDILPISQGEHASQARKARK